MEVLKEEEEEEEEGPISLRGGLLPLSESLPVCPLPLQQDMQVLPAPTIIRTVHLHITVSISV
jgi:hypothetical protein